MTDHDEMEHLAASYVLGALEEEEKARFEAHLSGCSHCQRSVQADLAVVDHLPLAVEMVEPPSELKRRLFRRIEEMEKTILTATPARWRGLVPVRPWRLLGPRWAAVSLGLAAALAAIGWTVSLQVQVRDVRQDNTVMAHTLEEQRQVLNEQRRMLYWVSSPALVRRDWRGTEAAPGSWGYLVFNDKGDQAMLLGANLPPLPKGQAYGVWLMDAQGQWFKPSSFRADDFGWAQSIFQAPGPLAVYKALLVTVGPEGSSSPVGAVYVLRIDF